MFKRSLTYSDFSSTQQWLTFLVQSEDGRHALVFRIIVSRKNVIDGRFWEVTALNSCGSVDYHFADEEEPDETDCPYVTGGKCRYHDTGYAALTVLVDEFRLTSSANGVWVLMANHLKNLMEDN